MNSPDSDRDPQRAAAAASPQVYAALLARLERGARDEAGRRGMDWAALMQDHPEAHSPARQALTLLQHGLFDAAWYVSTYPDVQAAGLDPLVHYVNLGDAEGRRPNACFDPTFYRAQFGSTPPRSVCALYHYAVMGEALGLKASGIFAARRYLVSNPLLRPWVHKPLTHYLHLGRPAGLTTHHLVRLSGSEKIPFVRRADTPPLPVGRIDPKEGINLIGPLDRISGLGVSARGYLDGLRRAGFTRLGCRAQQREFAIQKSIPGAPELPPYLEDARINLVHMNGDTLPVMIQEQGDGFLRGRYNIAIWYWELPTLRPEWQASMKHFHEFWAPTPFIARLLRQSTAKPVRLLPPYLGYLEGMKASAPAAGAPASFVYCFDANSILARKNPGALLKAFLQAFPDRRDVRLIFKVTYPNRKVEEVDGLYRAAERDERITVIDRLMSDTDLHALIGGATAYVSPHRSEGLGLTVIEAMASRVPVIATPFGGVDTFVAEETAFPLAYTLSELESDYAPYPRGYVWANPHIDALALCLQEVLAHPEETHQRSAAARRQVLGFFASPELPNMYRSALSDLAAAPAPSGR